MPPRTASSLSPNSRFFRPVGRLGSYLEFADALRQYGAAPNKDMPELWRRIVSSILISNTDDHLRNHGFLYEGPQGWRLAPAYDLNPVPADIKPRILSTTINQDDGTASLDSVLKVAKYFGLDGKEARKIAREVAEANGRWRAAAAALGLAKTEIDRTASAFEQRDLENALADGNGALK